MEYDELTTKEIVSLADKLRETIETCKNANVESALDRLRNAINLTPENTPAADKASEAILEHLEEMAYEVIDELENRLRVGRRLVERLERLEGEIIFEDDYPEHRYFIALAVDKDKLDISWNKWNGEVHNSYSYFRRDGIQEIPDENYLRDFPVEWLAEHLNDPIYDVDIPEGEEDYDEGFGEEEEEENNNVVYEEEEEYDEGFDDVE